MPCHRYQLSDTQWETVREFLPANGRRGKQWQDHRRILDGVLWALSDGGPWRNMPAEFGKWKTVYERFRRWSQEGLWDEILAELQVRKAVTGVIDWDLFAIDGTVVRAHQSAAGASKKSPRRASPGTTRWAGAGGASRPRRT
jgi:transposase